MAVSTTSYRNQVMELVNTELGKVCTRYAFSAGAAIDNSYQVSSFAGFCSSVFIRVRLVDAEPDHLAPVKVRARGSVNQVAELFQKLAQHEGATAFVVVQEPLTGVLDPAVGCYPLAPELLWHVYTSSLKSEVAPRRGLLLLKLEERLSDRKPSPLLRGSLW